MPRPTARGLRPKSRSSVGRRRCWAAGRLGGSEGPRAAARRLVARRCGTGWRQTGEAQRGARPHRGGTGPGPASQLAHARHPAHPGGRGRGARRSRLRGADGVKCQQRRRPELRTRTVGVSTSAPAQPPLRICAHYPYAACRGVATGGWNAPSPHITRRPPTRGRSLRSVTNDFTAGRPRKPAYLLRPRSDDSNVTD